MLIYSLPLFFLVLLVCSEINRKFQNILSSRIFYLSIFSIFLIFIGFRDKIGCDWDTYERNFKDIVNHHKNCLIKIQIQYQYFRYFINFYRFFILFLLKIKKNLFVTNDFLSILFLSNWNGTNKAIFGYIFFNACITIYLFK